MSDKPTVPATTNSGELVPVAPQRVREAQRMLTSVGYTETRDGLMAQFQISKSTAERTIREAYRLIASEAEEERPHLRNREVERLTRLAHAAEQDGDFNAAIKASAQLAKICGLEAPTTVHMGVSREQQAMLSGLMLTPHERRKRMAALEGDEGESGDEPS